MKLPPDNFMEGTRLIMLILRGKDGGKISKGDRIAKKQLSRNKEEFIKIVNEFELIRKSDERIYSSVNSRDINKAIREFKRRSLEADYYDQKSKEDFYYDIKNRWISCVMSSSCRAETNFLIDVDNPNDILDTEELLKKLEINILFKYLTKNGWHIITKPFNPALWNNKFGEIKKDSLLLISF
jgi:predicted metal-binding protein